mgnify:FL=1
MTSIVQRSLGAAAVGFGILTVISGFSVLFGGAGVAALAGDVVTGVLWFNALSGFVYVLAGVCIYRDGPFARRLAIGLALALALAFGALGWHILQGGSYEARTVAAMTVRLGFWAAIATYLHRQYRRG